MIGLEYENFYLLDDRRYILKENYEFLDWYSNKNKEGYQSIISVEQMQKLINEIVKFYELKYPDELFDSVKHKNDIEFTKQAKEISKMLNFDQLKFRLYHDYVQFLECSYGYMVNLKREKKHMCDLSEISVRVLYDGLVVKTDLENLEEQHFLEDIEGINTIEHLYGKFESTDNDVDYCDLKKCIKNHKYNQAVRNRILKLIPYAMIYSESTMPEYGYVRAKSFIRTFNREYKLNLDIGEISEIMKIDYSQTEVIKKMVRDRK